MTTLSTPSRSSSITWLGLFIALFMMLIVRQAVSYFYPAPNFTSALWREGFMWISALALLVLIRRGERLPFSSIGIGTAPVGMSILWGVILTIVCLAVALGLAHLTGYGHGRGSGAMEKLPLWLVTAIVVRAGVIEELFYRGYAIERLQAVGLNRYAAAIVPLLIFGAGHWTGGWANIVIALAIGGVLAAFYLWRRDLVATIIAHFMVDFVGNVLPRLFA